MIFYLKASKQKHSFTFYRTKAKTFFPYVTVFLYTVLYLLKIPILWLYGRFLSIFKAFPMIARERPWICLHISTAKLWIFLWCVEKVTFLTSSSQKLMYNLIIYTKHYLFWLGETKLICWSTGPTDPVLSKNKKIILKILTIRLFFLFYYFLLFDKKKK